MEKKIMPGYLLTIDQGTTSSRAIIFDEKGHPVGQHRIEFQQYFPESGWVEHDAEEIWQSTLQCCWSAVRSSGLSFNDILAIGITNQRETTVLWDRETGVPIHRAIVWQDRRTAQRCQQLKEDGQESLVQQKTGLLLDPYFSATKIAWLLEHIPKARAKAQEGKLAFGTIDSFLLWRLTQGQSHATDATNASRTLLFNIHEQQWDQELLKLFAIPQSILPKVLDNCADFGDTHPAVFGHAVPITAMAGDQQAALVGQTCFDPGMVKSTYGTGAFMMLNTGQSALVSSNRLLTTVAYRLKGKVTYAMEGSIFSAGSIVQWLRDKLGLVRLAAETETIANSISDNGGVYFVPAFTGLGAPYWQPEVRAAIEGLTRDNTAAHVVRAGLEAVAYQTRDLVNAMMADGASRLTAMRVDGGMVVNNWLMQFLSDILELPVDRPVVTETTALGVAFLAGLGCGLYRSLDEIKTLWSAERRFVPHMPPEKVRTAYQGWQDAVRHVLNK